MFGLYSNLKSLSSVIRYYSHLYSVKLVKEATLTVEAVHDDTRDSSDYSDTLILAAIYPELGVCSLGWFTKREE